VPGAELCVCAPAALPQATIWDLNAHACRHSSTPSQPQPTLTQPTAPTHLEGAPSQCERRLLLPLVIPIIIIIPAFRRSTCTGQQQLCHVTMCLMPLADVPLGLQLSSELSQNGPAPLFVPLRPSCGACSPRRKSTRLRPALVAWPR
jgi:hypothetical protein